MGQLRRFFESTSSTTTSTMHISLQTILPMRYSLSFSVDPLSVFSFRLPSRSRAPSNASLVLLRPSATPIRLYSPNYPTNRVFSKRVVIHIPMAKTGTRKKRKLCKCKVDRGRVYM
ncbi:unnamed protein product [Cyclocybe aegerita]|uniref:Uncharacterized protein n=1 Tax=Cyclocybe aegerita TaxID=1973307 RepID=A0A8S0WYQ1_CYCAE|nr:unnamed protein product [Cyclocybe aegerita]